MPHDEGHYSPEELLWRAVLVVGLIEVTSTRPAGQLARADAEQWIASTSTDAYSFEWICELLKIDPQATRKAIRDITPHHRQSLSPTLRNLVGTARKTNGSD